MIFGDREMAAISTAYVFNSAIANIYRAGWTATGNLGANSGLRAESRTDLVRGNFVASRLLCEQGRQPLLGQVGERMAYARVVDREEPKRAWAPAPDGRAPPDAVRASRTRAPRRGTPLPRGVFKLVLRSGVEARLVEHVAAGSRVARSDRLIRGSG